MVFNSELFADTLITGLKEFSLQLQQDQLEQMIAYAEKIVKVNQHLNLTRITEPKEMAVKNFLDSLVLLSLPWQGELKVIDVGTGAGFPGVPLALACPSWSFVLLDSLRKRLDFIATSCEEFAITNVKTRHARAEEAGRETGEREAYDLVVSRAVASLPVLLELCTPLLKVGGHFAAYKASEADEELAESEKALDKLHVELEQTFAFVLPYDLGERKILLFRKIAPTPKRYPRRPGIPAKRPLS